MVGDERPPRSRPPELTAGLRSAHDAGAELTAGLRPGHDAAAELTAGLRPGHDAGAELAAGLRAGYDAAAERWADGPGPMYTPLAWALVAAAPVPLAGATVLDLGAGDGAAGQAALAAGAGRVVAADLSAAMLGRGASAARPGLPMAHPVAADATALPFRDRSFDLVLAAFCFNHLASLTAGLAEARRVGAALAASMFAPGWTHPAKDAVDQALRSFGHQPPAWHAALNPGSRTSDPAQLAAAAAAAGFTQVQVHSADVPTGLSTPAELASWRLGMAHVAPFMRSLDAPGQAAVRRAAERAVTGARPVIVSMTVLTAR
jgi:ubiquinone/menaquinone biosynthesis C-methylase UbiE